jgi:DNA polymerase III epsilon subunit-like protein
MTQNIIVFDTETTGLIPKFSDQTENPYITQLSFIVYNIPTNTIKTSYNAYIRIPDEVVVPEIVTKLTGITKEKCINEGIPFQEAFTAFYYAAACCDFIVGHNIDFDIQMLYIEIFRNKHYLLNYPEDLNLLFHPETLYEKGIDIRCTMRMTVKECALFRTTNKNYTYRKFPKLAESYFYLFQKVPANLHNSIIDVIVCLRCFLKIKFSIDISEETFQEWMKIYL